MSGAGAPEFDCELRADSGGRTLTGVVVRYGDRASLYGFTELVRAGAFSFDDVILNVQHDRGRALARTGGGLTLQDGPDRMTMRAALPETREADDVLALVRSGVLRGLSVGMKVDRDEWRRVGGRDRRIVTKAVIRHIAVVDTPAYRDSSVQARAKAPRRWRLWR